MWPRQSGQPRGTPAKRSVWSGLRSRIRDRGQGEWRDLFASPNPDSKGSPHLRCSQRSELSGISTVHRQHHVADKQTGFLRRRPFFHAYDHGVISPAVTPSAAPNANAVIPRWLAHWNYSPGRGRISADTDRLITRQWRCGGLLYWRAARLKQHSCYKSEIASPLPHEIISWNFECEQIEERHLSSMPKPREWLPRMPPNIVVYRTRPHIPHGGYPEPIHISPVADAQTHR